MVRYHFYTGSYLAHFLQSILAKQTEANYIPKVYNTLTMPNKRKYKRQCVHVLFYESLIKAFRDLFRLSQSKCTDTNTYTIMHYGLTSLCLALLQQEAETCYMQCIHLIYSAGNKLTLKGSLRTSERSLSRMVQEMDYRFF